MSQHSVGDILFGINQYSENPIVGVIKKIKYVGDQWHYQIEWSNDLFCDEWYRQPSIEAYKETYQEYIGKVGKE